MICFLLQIKDSLQIELENLNKIESDLQADLNSVENTQNKLVQSLLSLKQQVSIISDVQEKLNVSQQTLTEEMKRILNTQKET